MFNAPPLTPAQVILDIRCASCIFFSPSPSAPARLGQCRRNAPILDMMGDRPRSLWPLVGVDAFCGEHSTLEESGDE